MRLIAGVVILVCISSGVGVAQSETGDLKDAQAGLKKALIKNTRNVYDVDQSGCEASIRVVTGSTTSPFPLAAPPPQGSAGFPTDTFGPDYRTDPVTFERSVRFLIDFSKLDVSQVLTRPGFRKNTSVIMLSADDNGAIRRKADKRTEPASLLPIVTSAKSASKTVDAIKRIIQKCSGGG